MRLPYSKALRTVLRTQHERAIGTKRAILNDLADRDDRGAVLLRGLADGSETAYDKLAGPKDVTPIACYETLACLAHDKADALNLLDAAHPTPERAYAIGQLDGYADSCQRIYDAYRKHEKDA